MELLLTQTYQAKSGFIHRKVAGADVLVSVGANVENFNGYIELNPSASFLWDALKSPTTGEALAQQLSDTFGIPLSQAQADVLDFVQELLANNMAEVC